LKANRAVRLHAALFLRQDEQEVRPACFFLSQSNILVVDVVVEDSDLHQRFQQALDVVPVFPKLL
jgi:hypothetical protein